MKNILFRDSKKGVTMTSLVIYVIVATVIVAIIAFLNVNFFSNINELTDKSQIIGECLDFKSAFLKDIKSGTDIKVTEYNDHMLRLSNNVKYEIRVLDKEATEKEFAIYRDDVQLAKHVVTHEELDGYTVKEGPYFQYDVATNTVKLGIRFSDGENAYMESGTYVVGKGSNEIENTVLTTPWECEISFVGSDGVSIIKQKVYAGKVVTIPGSSEIKEGYRLLGWSKVEGSKNVDYKVGQEASFTTDFKLYPVWQSNKYVVKYEANGGVNGELPAQQDGVYGTELKLTSARPTRRKYKFLGWSTSETGTEIAYIPGEVYTDEIDATLYAVWESELIPSIANAPLLGDGMKAVWWNDDNVSSETVRTTYAANSYNYTIGDGVEDTKQARWANAKTDDGSYWVWIPRYAYKITYYTNDTKTTLSVNADGTPKKSQFGDIDVIFLSGKSDLYYKDINGKEQKLPTGYIVHPAFQAMKLNTEDTVTNPLGKWDTELTGIWVAKYEASREDRADENSDWYAYGTSDYGGGNILTTNGGNEASATQIRVVSKPSVTSWRNIYETTIFKNCEKMYEELNSHQMKNSEWGAVAYLTYSPYGRNGNELAVNQCSSYYTGAGKGEGGSTVYNDTYEYSEDFATKYAWNTMLGKLASTTGNIYGVYDMSGGAGEYTASYVANGNGNLNNYGANMVSAESPLKYKQIYGAGEPEGQQNNYDANLGVYGDAVYETSTSYWMYYSWCSDNSTFPYDIALFFNRGGGYGSGSGAGVIAFSGLYGYDYFSYTFRPVLCID